MTREDLKNYINNEKWINSEIELYEEQKQRAESLKSPIIDGLPKPKNKPNYAIEELIDCYNVILDYCYKLQLKQNEIVRQLGQMENTTYRNILYYRYIKGLSYEEIATEINYDYYNTVKFHGYALNEFDKLDKVTNFDQDSPKKI